MTAQRPLDPEAVKAANEKLWAEHDELGGRELTLGNQDPEPDLRGEWMEAYEAALKEQGVNPPTSGDGPVGSPTLPCEKCKTKADLMVTVTDQNGSLIEGATVEIKGPESRSGVTAADGTVAFRGIKASPPQYTLTGSKEGYASDTRQQAVPAGAATQATLVLQVDRPRLIELWIAKNESSWDRREWSDVIRESITLVGKLDKPVPDTVSWASCTVDLSSSMTSGLRCSLASRAAYKVEVSTENGTTALMELDELELADRAMVRGTLPAADVEAQLGIIAPRRSFVSCDNTDGVDSDAFDSGMAGAGFGPKLAGARGSGDGSATPAANPSFILAGGAQLLIAEHEGVSTNGLLKYEAEYLYYSGHGFHDDGTLVLNRGNLTPNPAFRSAEHPAPPWWTHGRLRVLIIAGCSVLDMETDPKPGTHWSKTGARIYLGYDESAPGDAGGVPSKVITAWCASLGSGKGTAEEWVKINRTNNATNTCAFDLDLGKYYSINLGVIEEDDIADLL